MAYACDDIGKEKWFKPQVTPESLTSDMKVAIYCIWNGNGVSQFAGCHLQYFLYTYLWILICAAYNCKCVELAEPQFDWHILLTSLSY